MGTPPPIEMANLGMADSLILMVLALVVFGPRRLPEIGRQIGKLMYEFRKASNDFKFQMEEELRNAEESDRRKKEEERLRALALAAPAQTIEPVTPVSESGRGAPMSGDAVTLASESGPGAPDASSDAAVTSPYPENIEYPSGVTITPAEELYPSIRPPETGEPVQAAAPFAAAVQPATNPEAAQDQAQQPPPAATEPVAHHG